jgi:hypothetical protein
MKGKENQRLLEQLKTISEQRVELEVLVYEQKALEAKREVAELNKMSFQSHRNRKRLLPIKINPCWKKDIN